MRETESSGDAQRQLIDTLLSSEHASTNGGPLKVWLMLIGVLIISAVPMLAGLGRADSKRTMENITMLSAQETWLRQHGWQDIEPDPNAWLMPTRNGNPRFVKPPMVVWMDMLSWTGLTPQTSTVEQLIFRARVVSVGMGLMTVLGVFWIGYVIKDYKLAVLSALAAGTCLFLQRQARIASYDMHMTGWATLAVASAVWAMRPFGSAPGIGRQVVGWCLAGVALSASFLSKGPLALMVGGLPVLMFIVLYRENWRRWTVGLLGMLTVAGLLTAPWYLYLLSEIANAKGQLLHEYKAERMEFQPPYYYLGLLGLVVPWSVWLVGGVFQPWMRGEGDSRRRLLLAWCWFVLIFVAFSLPGAKQQRYILPIMPAAALLIGQLWRYHETLAKRNEMDPGVNLLRVPHWVMVIGASLAAWPFFVSQEWMLERGWFEQLPIGDAPPVFAACAGVVLTVLGVIGARLHFQWKPYQAAVVMAVWASVLTTLVWYAWATSPRSVHPVKASSQAVAREIDGAVVARLRHPRYLLTPNEEFLLYARRIVKPVRL